MKIAVIYPPLKRHGKLPLLTQNRQFRYSSSNNVKIFPLIPASATTMLKREGYEVLWLDGINERLSHEEFLQRLYDFSPHFAVIETKAPIVSEHWRFIDQIKKEKGISSILVGDHVSYNPVESLEHSEVDYVITGGDYDVTLLNLARSLDQGGELPPGVYLRKGSKIINSGNAILIDNLDQLPFVDRDLTKWQNYGEAYLYHPVAYILTGRGCGGGGRTPGRCSFCVWQHLLWKRKARLRSPKNVVQEIKMLVDKYHVKEIFDDNESGAMWNKEWLQQFYLEMKREKLIGRLFISSNARADSLDESTCYILKESGYRLLKIGIESGNNTTLARLHKDEVIEDMVKGIKIAKDYGLIIMLTFMVGYPWENQEEVRRTYQVAKEILFYKTHLGDCLQSSVVIPYPGTPLYKEAIENNWFIINPQDYHHFDMSKPVLKSPIAPMQWCDKMWDIHTHPLFILKTLLSLRSIHDIKLLYGGVKSLKGHTKDF